MIKKVKLKTWKQFVEEFCTEENVRDLITYYSTMVIYDGFKWYINNQKKRIFGSEILIKEIKGDENYGDCTYTYKMCNDVFGIHELWIEPVFEDFLDEKDMEL